MTISLDSRQEKLYLSSLQSLKKHFVFVWILLILAHLKKIWRIKRKYTFSKVSTWQKSQVRN